MVWGLFPADPLPGEDRYYILSKGTYKVGRKGCEIIVNKDKGVSRIHAEIMVDEMASSDYLQTKSADMSSKVRIRDCSKYGTFVTKNLGLKEKINEFPGKELKDGDLVSFGTGNATYRFCYVPLVFFIYGSETFEADLLLQEKILSIGAHMIRSWSPDCTHVLVDQVIPLTKDVVDAFVAKKPFVLKTWVELVAEKNICTEIPSCSSSAPTLMLDGVPVKIAEPKSREHCLKGYTFLLGPIDRYYFEDKLWSLLEMVGAKVASLEGYCANSQGIEDEEEHKVVHVLPRRMTEKAESSRNQRSLGKVNEMDLICAAFSGQLDPSIIISEPVVVSSSCSTDETVVAESDAELETATSKDISAALKTTECTKQEAREELSANPAATRLESIPITISRDTNNTVLTRRSQVDEPESGNVDILYSQDLVIRDTNLKSSICSPADNGVPNFKCFRKSRIHSGNSFNNLVPFSKYPYKDSEHETDEVIKSVKEEKKRKQMEAIADDLFNSEKVRRRGAAGSLHGLLTRR